MNSHDIAKQIRSRFRTRMDGVVSEQMRNSGVGYHINWGISLMHLKDLAADYQQDMHVALELWKDNVRESKIMALLLMPADEFTADLADVWIETITTQEIAEMAAMLLFQNLSYAPGLAFNLIAAKETLRQILGYNILSRLFAKDMLPNERAVEELKDQAQTAMTQTETALRRAAYNCLVKLSQHEGYQDVI